MSVRQRPVVLCVLDGWGFREDAPDNATTRGNAPVFRHAWATSPHALLDASEEHVGLPAGQMGNSEVGHMNLGAGRVVWQDFPMINHAIATGALAPNPALQAMIAALKKSGGVCHLMGLISTGGVHSYPDHIEALTRIIAEAGVPVAVHAFLDGRDVPPQSAPEHIGRLLDFLATVKGAKLATMCGRYYGMDRDKRWERIERAYTIIAQGEGARADNALDAIQASYAAGVFDEFLLPVALGDYAGMKDGDGVLFANFRTDRAREILTTLLDPAFKGFARKKTISFAAALGMVEYSEALNALMTTLFPPKIIEKGLGEVVAEAGLTQLRIAETEKYAHVTFFFNGGREEPFMGESRILVPSPKVATYDLQPEMSAPEVTDKVVAAIEADSFDLMILNYANPDMLGHTGVLDAAIKMIETIDACLARLFAAVEKRGGVIVLTADHGNCEIMYDPTTHGPHTAHTLDRVPVMLIGASPDVTALRDGKLADVAPTLLELLHLPKPAVMDGQSLIVRT